MRTTNPAKKQGGANIGKIILLSSCALLVVLSVVGYLYVEEIFQLIAPEPVQLNQNQVVKRPPRRNVKQIVGQKNQGNRPMAAKSRKTNGGNRAIALKQKRKPIVAKNNKRLAARNLPKKNKQIVAKIVKAPSVFDADGLQYSWSKLGGIAKLVNDRDLLNSNRYRRGLQLIEKRKFTSAKDFIVGAYYYKHPESCNIWISYSEVYYRFGKSKWTRYFLENVIDNRWCHEPARRKAELLLDHYFLDV